MDKAHGEGSIECGNDFEVICSSQNFALSATEMNRLVAVPPPTAGLRGVLSLGALICTSTNNSPRPIVYANIWVLHLTLLSTSREYIIYF